MRFSHKNGPKLSLSFNRKKMDTFNESLRISGIKQDQNLELLENTFHSQDDLPNLKNPKEGIDYQTKTNISCNRPLLRNAKSEALKQFFKIQKVKMAMQKLIRNSYSVRFKNMTSLHQFLFNDIINFQDLKGKIVQSQKHVLDNLNNQLKHYYQWVNLNLPIFKSDSKFWLIWDLIMLILIFFFMFSFSVELTFDIVLEQEISAIYCLKIISCIFFSLNIFIKMNTEYFEYGICVKERHKIMINYIKNMFFWDFISLFSLIISFGQHQASLYCRFLFFFSYFNIRKLFQNLNEHRITNDFIEICLLLFRLICISHFIACLWHSIAYYDLIVDPNHWLDDYREFGWRARYMYSLYWAITTLCTVGYGDITPKNLLEMGYCSFVMLMGTLIFGYSINSIGILINRIEQRGKELGEKMTIIDNFMDKSNIKEDLRIKVKNYLQYIWKSDDKSLEKAEEIIKNLPINLREEILFESVGKLIQNTSVLKNNFSAEFLNRIALKIKPIRYSPCDIIYNKGDIDEQALFIIKEGQIDLIYEDHQKQDRKPIILKQLKPGDFFGELPFFVACPFEETSISRSFAIVYKISRNDFIDLLIHSFSEDYEKFSSIKDKISLYRNYINSYTSCLSCKKTDHRINDCHFLFVYTNFKRSMILQKHIYSKTQIRTPFSRNSLRKLHFNSLLSHKEIKENAQIFTKNTELMELYQKQVSLKNILVRKDSKSLHTLMTFDEDFEKNLESSSKYKENNSSDDEEEVEEKNKSNDKFQIQSKSENSLIKLEECNNIIDERKCSNNNKLSVCESAIQIFYEDRRGSNNVDLISKSNSIRSPKNVDKAKTLKSNITKLSHLDQNQKHETMETKDQFMCHFDLMKEFKFYYKEGNATKILRKLQGKMTLANRKRRKASLFYNFKK